MSHIIDAKLAVTLDKQQLKTTINHLQNQVANAKVGRNVYAPVIAGAKQYRSELSLLNSGIEQQSRRYAILARTLSTLSGQYLGLYSAYRLVGQGVAAFTKYEDELTAVRQITSASIYDTKILSQEVRNLGIQYGVASDAIMGTSIELLQAGQSMKDVKSLVPILAQLAKNSQVGAEGLKDIARATTIWKEVFKGTTNDELGLALGKSVQLSKAGLIEVNDLIESSSILGKVWQQNGESLDSLLSTITAVKQGSGRPAQEASRAISSILTQLLKKNTQDALAGYGINLFDKNKQFRGALPILTDIAKLRKQLGLSSKAALELDRIMAGTFRAGIAKTLYDSIDEINRYNRETKASGVLTEDAGYAADNLSTKLTRLKETAKDSAIQFGETFGGGVLKNMVDTTTQLVRMRTELLALSLIPLSKVFGSWRDKISGEIVKRKSMFNIYGGIQPRGNRTPFLKNAHRGMMRTGGYGLGGAAALYASANVPLQSDKNAVGAAAFAGLGAGLLSIQMGIHPLVAAFIGLGTAATKLASSFAEVENNQVKAGIVEQQTRMDRATSLGLFDKSTLAEAKRTADLLKVRSEKADEKPHWFSVMMNWSGDAIKDNQLRKEKRSTFFNESQGARTTIAQYRQAFLESGTPIEQFDSWQGGIMKTMEQLDDLTDDLVGLNFSSKLKQSIINELEVRKKAAEDLKKSLENSNDDFTDEVIEKIQGNITKTLTKKYGDTNSAFSTLMGDLQNQNQIREGISAFKTKPGRKNLYDTNTEVKNTVYKLRQYTQQAMLGVSGTRTITNIDGEKVSGPNYKMALPTTAMGGNTIEDLDKELKALTKSLIVNDDRFGATSSQINQTRSALSLLADVSKRTASSFEELNRLTNLQNAQGDFAEWSLTASRSELRDMGRGKDLAQSLFSSGQGMETLSRRDREKVLEYTRATGGIDAGITGRDNIMSGLTGTEVRDVLLSSSGIGKSIGMDKTMAEQRKEEKKIGEIMAEGKKAQDVLLADSFTAMNNATAALSTAITNSALIMNKAGDKYLQAAAAIPSNLTWDGRVQVDLVGGQQLLDGIEPLVVSIINRSLNGKAQVVDATMPPAMNSAKTAIVNSR